MARAYGSGSKRERQPGVWELRANGRSTTFRGTGKEAEKALSKFASENSLRQTAPAGATMGQLIDRWLEVTAVDPSTRERYERALRLHLPAEVRNWKIARLQLTDFDRLYKRLQRDGVKPYPIDTIHTALSAALTEGIRMNWLTVHPARGARTPALPTSSAAMPSDDALAKLLAVARRDPQTLAWFVTSLALGSRRSELLALRWSQVDLERRTINIEASLRKDRTVKGTKTNRARLVDIDRDTATVLAAWRTAQLARAALAGAALAADPYVLSHELDGGAPWRPDGATQRFGRLRKQAGVSGVRLNDLRHASVSFLLAARVPVGDVSKRVGHSRTSTTQDVYGKLLEGADERAATAIGDAIRRIG